MPVLANIEVIWVIIIIISVIAQVIKGAKKVASQAQVKSTGADEATSEGGKPHEFVAPDDALKEFLRSLGGGEKPVARPANASPVQAKSVRRGLSQARAKVKTQPRQSTTRGVSPPTRTNLAPVFTHTAAGKVQAAVVLEKFSTRKTSASILGEAIRKDLSNADAIRKAIVLREVLGPPVALRG